MKKSTVRLIVRGASAVNVLMEPLTIADCVFLTLVAGQRLGALGCWGWATGRRDLIASPRVPR